MPLTKDDHHLPRALLSPIPWSKGSSRTGYGVPVFERIGYSCLYCERDMKATYEDWLDLSVDNIVPYNLIEKWIDDLSNAATCCRHCNEFLARFKLDSSAPKSLKEFFDLRDKVYLQKKELALSRHEEERAWFEENVGGE